MPRTNAIFLLAEAQADAETVTCIADRLLLQHAPSEEERECGLNSTWLKTRREWKGLEGETRFTKWTGIKELAKQHRIRVLGGGGMDRDMLRKAVLVAERVRGENPRWMVVSRDLDTQHPEERRTSLEHIREEYRAQGWCIVLAVAAPFREAWVLHGFVPESSGEKSALKDERAKLGFDPTLSPEKLTAQNETAKQNAKRVLNTLLASARSRRDREQACLEQTPLTTLREKARHTGGSGLSTFFDDFESVFLPELLK